MYILKLSYKGSDGIYHDGEFFSGFGMAYRSEYEIFRATLKTNVNSIGHFSFTIYSSHPLYEFVNQPKALLEIIRYDVDEPLFVGRMAECITGLYNEKKLTFESELSFLLDSIRTDFSSVAGHGCEYWLNEILEYHNTHGGNFGSIYTENIQRKFKCGFVSESIRIRCTDIPEEIFDGSFSTLEIIRMLLLEKYGGVLKIRHADGFNYIDWLEDDDLHVCSQKIEFASNLISIENSVATDEIVTTIRPVGENVQQGSESKPLNILGTDVSGFISVDDIFQVTDDTVSETSTLHFTDTLYSQSLVNEYGWICREVYFSGVTNTADLTRKAVYYLSNAGQKQSIVINAADLSAVGNSIENFLAGDIAVVNSAVHSFYNEKMLITSVTLNLSDPSAGEIVLGNETESITSLVGTNTVNVSSSGGYSGNSGEGVDIDKAVKTAVEEAKKYTDTAVENKVDKENGKSLSTNDFTDSYRSQIETNAGNISELKSRADTLDSGMSALSEQVGKKAEASDVYTKSETDAKISAVNESIATHSQQTTKNSSDITALDNRVSTLENSETDLSNYYTKAQVNSKCSTLEGYINTNTSDISALETNVRTNTADIANSKKTIGILQGTLGFEAKNKFNNTTTSSTVSGVTFTVNDDGTITAKGTATANITFQLKPNLYIQNNNWAGNIFSFGVIESSKKYRGLIQYYNSSWTLQNSTYLSSTETTLLDYYCAVASIYITKGTTLSNVVFKPMIRDANIEDDSYSSYGGLSVIKRFDRFSTQKLLYSTTTSSSSPLTVNVSNLFANYSAVVCYIKTSISTTPYNLTLPLKYIKSLGTGNYYNADSQLMFEYVDDSNLRILTGMAQSNPTIENVRIISLY